MPKFKQKCVVNFNVLKVSAEILKMETNILISSCLIFILLKKYDLDWECFYFGSW